MGGLSYAQASIFAWLNHVFFDKAIEPRESSDLFVELFGKYGGESGMAKAKELLGEVAFII
jgi:hypothetical protein